MKLGDTVCDARPDERKGQEIVGMNVITDMVRKSDAYEGGQILDPIKGKVYDGKMWEGNGTLKVLG